MSADRSDANAAKLIILLFILGGLSTGLWIGTLQFPVFREHILSGRTITGLAVCLALTSLNLVARWFRWHFLVRRFTRHVATRDSLLVYFSTLPTILTPFSVGELLRVLLLRKSAPGAAGHLVWVWVIERFMDIAVLVAFLLLVQENRLFWLGAAGVAVIGYLALRLLFTRRSARVNGALSIGVFLVTVVAWLLPIFALFITLNLFHAAPVKEAVTTFSEGTLLGGITGLPMGVLVTGSTMIRELTSAEIPHDVAVLSTLIFRIGTAYFAVFLGFAVFFIWKRRLTDIARNVPDSHFDEIAEGYVNEIPEHVRAGLLGKKVDLIRARLEQNDISPPARGLDLGCGQGWYLGELTRAGYAMLGADYSGNQVAQGHRHLQRSGIESHLFQADGQALPFADNTFDFAYSINAFHHILSPGSQAKAFEEVVRVLKPGGVFLFHEMNTVNPVFRFYMGYLFPLLRRIDQGDEQWILPTALPQVAGATWREKVDYFTFVPDFVPKILHKRLSRLEAYLEQSKMKRYSAHYQAVLMKAPSDDSILTN